MMEIKKFVELMTGEFDNKEQFMEMKEAGKSFHLYGIIWIYG